jgi:hypothetical protein
VHEFQDAVVQTQLFLGYVDRVRTEYNLLEPYRYYDFHDTIVSFRDLIAGVVRVCRLFISNWVRFHWFQKKNRRMAQQAQQSEDQDDAVWDANNGNESDHEQWVV